MRLGRCVWAQATDTKGAAVARSLPECPKRPTVLTSDPLGLTRHDHLVDHPKQRCAVSQGAFHPDTVSKAHIGR